MTRTKRKSAGWRKAPSKTEIALVAILVGIIFAVEMGWVLG